MTFGNPAALFLGLLAIPVLACYAWRTRPRRYRVATGFLWQQLASGGRARAAWRRWRRPVSACLELTVLGLLVLAAADPHLPPSPRGEGLSTGSEVSVGSPGSHADSPSAGNDSRAPRDAFPPGPERRPLWMVLAAAAVLLLAIEWGLYQRRWVC